MSNVRFTILMAAMLLGCGERPVPVAGGRPAPRRERVVHRTQFAAGGLTLKIELLDDDLVHLSLQRGAAPVGPIAASPMVSRVRHLGPRELKDDGKGMLTTAELTLRVDPVSLAVTLQHGLRRLTRLRPLVQGGVLRGLLLDRGPTRNVYGLGQQLTTSPGDWLGRVRTPGSVHGNRMVPFEGGAVGNNQFSVMFALADGRQGYGLFVDRPEAQRWDLRSDPLKVTLAAEAIQLYLMLGPDLPDLRRDYMELTGRPPVPPMRALGLWVSEYGYRSFDEVRSKLASLRKHGFPVDGFVLDLFWFGGIERGSPDSRMGSLSWDTTRFPSAAKQIQELRALGVGVMLIEESYVSKGLPGFQALKQAGHLVHHAAPDGRPVILDSWWGLGSMIDWTRPAAGDFWHDRKRAPLVAHGVVGHWTDLGEPEDFDADGWYHGFPPRFDHRHDAVANLYNFAWVQGIHRGYRRHRTLQRPFVLTRSGAPGIQRFGAAMWSGDIGSNARSLEAHLAAQMQMSLSGVDYFGSDIGGFHRGALDGELDPLYTRWLACGAALDVPVRPHTNNLERRHETAPDRVGHVTSNRASVRLRYELGPYLYSLAHRASRDGEAVFPPPVYHYQQDPAVRRIWRQRMIGRDLMLGLEPDVYLPAGRWYDYRDGKQIDSRGQWLRGVSLKRDGLFMLPLYARAGAVIPRMRVDDGTLNMLGQRADGSRRDELVLRVFGGAPGSFTLYEDDGETVAYLDGAVRRTSIRQRPTPAGGMELTIGGARGTYASAPERREVRVTVVGVEKVTRVSLDRIALRRLPDAAALERAGTGWTMGADGTVHVRAGARDVTRGTVLAIDHDPSPGSRPGPRRVGRWPALFSGASSHST